MPLCVGALAVFHEHVPVVGPGAAFAVARAQRRDQHAPGQQELDACPGGRDEVGAVWPGARQALPDHRGGRLRLGSSRQRARALGDQRRAHATGGHHGARSRGLAAQRALGPEAQGVLRVGRLPHGALGRPGVVCVRRRPVLWGPVGPERTPALPLLCDQRQHHCVCLRGGCCACGVFADHPEGASSAWPDASCGHCEGSDCGRPGAQAADIFPA